MQGRDAIFEKVEPSPCIKKTLSWFYHIWITTRNRTCLNATFIHLGWKSTFNTWKFTFNVYLQSVSMGWKLFSRHQHHTPASGAIISKMWSSWHPEYLHNQRGLGSSKRTQCFIIHFTHLKGGGLSRFSEWVLYKLTSTSPVLSTI